MKQDNTKLAVKCNNGTFVGKETDELIIWKGIPYATQPVGKLRWKKALSAARRWSLATPSACRRISSEGVRT